KGERIEGREASWLDPLEKCENDGVMLLPLRHPSNRERRSTPVAGEYERGPVERWRLSLGGLAIGAGYTFLEHPPLRFDQTVELRFLAAPPVLVCPSHESP